MTKAQYEAIKARAAAVQADSEDPPIVLICVNENNEPIHPDELGPEVSARFKKRCEAFAQASADRRDLMQFIEDGFDIEWPDEEARTPTTQKGE